MDRLNAEGIPRSQLAWALGQRRIVLLGRRRGECLLCRATPVNEACLCDLCMACLTEHELGLAERWMAGRGP